MRNLVVSYYSRQQCQEGAAEDSAPPLWRRFLLLSLIFVVLQPALTPAGVLLPSERLLIAVPLLWFADFIYCRRHVVVRDWSVSRRCYVFGALGVGLVLLLLTFWSLLDWQAREMNGRVPLLEPLSRCYVTISLWLLFYALYRALDFMLEKSTLFSLRAARSLLAFGVATVLFLPYLFVALQIHRGKIANATNPLQKLGLPYETVALRAEDGVLLQGWFIPHRGSDAAVLLCHGVSANKGAFLDIVPFLHRAGFNVFMLDFRGHGDSAGFTSSLGYFETRDVTATTRYLEKRSDIKRIAGFGFSMGGATLLQAAPQIPYLAGVVADSAFADLESLARQQVSFLPNSLENIALRVLSAYTRLSLGVPLKAIAPADHIGKINPRPVLLIHGTDDQRVPVAQARRNFNAAQQPKHLWLVPEAGHVESYRVKDTAYEQRVVQFLRRCLKK